MFSNSKLLSKDKCKHNFILFCYTENCTKDEITKTNVTFFLFSQKKQIDIISGKIREKKNNPICTLIFYVYCFQKKHFLFAQHIFTYRYKTNDFTLNLDLFSVVYN